MSEDFYTPERIKADFEVPDAVMPLVLAHPRLLPGERRDEFYSMFEMMVLSIFPETELEWLATIDLAWLQWEIQRYRRWKNVIIANNRAVALENALCKTYRGSPPLLSTIRAESKKHALEMIANPDARGDLRVQLESHGYDTDAINAGAFELGLMPLAAIERFLSSARHQIMVTLREIEHRREFARRAREAMKRIDAEPTSETKQIEAK